MGYIIPTNKRCYVKFIKLKLFVRAGTVEMLPTTDNGPSLELAHAFIDEVVLIKGGGKVLRLA